MTGRACVRTPRGRLHVARLEGRTWVAACYRAVRGRELVIYRGRDAAKAWRLEVTCTDCERLLARGPAGLRRAAGWDTRA